MSLQVLVPLAAKDLANGDPIADWFLAVESGPDALLTDYSTLKEKTMITHNLVGKTPTIEELMARIQELEAERQVGISFKIGAKGAVSVYGLGRNPSTLYVGQWERFLDAIQAPVNSPLRVFIKKAVDLGFVAVKDEEYTIPDKDTLTPDELSMFSKNAWGEA